jgi:transcription termination factor NusB
MRHHSFGPSMRMIARQVARAQRARQRAEASERAAAVRALRNAERQVKADAKEAARLHVAAQIEEAEDLSRAVQDREKALGNLLTRALAKNPMVDLTSVLLYA